MQVIINTSLIRNRKSVKLISANYITLFFLMLLSYSSLSQTISSFSPVSGPTGSQGSTAITITGTGFNATPSNNLVFFGAVSATPSSATTTSLTVTVPAGATYQYLSVLNKTTQLRATAYLQEPFMPTFYNEGTMQLSGTVNFSLPYISTKPYFKVGDIDGDGKPDIVLLNVAANTVSVLRNTSTPGTVSFAAAVDITTGTTPKCIVIDDMDGDGKQDLVVGNSGDLTFSVMLNNSSTGSISFAAKVDFSPGSTATVDEIGSCDVDGDGKQDIFCMRINGAASLLQTLLNTSTVGSVSFTYKNTSPVNTTKNVIFADFDKDGKVDWAVASGSTGLFDVERNTSVPGSLTISGTFNISAGSNPAWIASGDFDGDGKPDLVSTNAGGSNVVTLLNTSILGSHNFNGRVGNGLGTTPSCVVAGDFDGDGKPDLAVSGKGNSTINIFRNNSTSGSILFGGRVSLPTITSPDFLAFCDFDGDGKPDLAVVNSSTLSIYRSLSKDKFMFRLAF